jgi:hypothetical protein
MPPSNMIWVHFGSLGQYGKMLENMVFFQRLQRKENLEALIPDHKHQTVICPSLFFTGGFKSPFKSPNLWGIYYIFKGQKV